MQSQPEKPYRSSNHSTEENNSIAGTSLDFIAEEYDGINLPGGG